VVILSEFAARSFWPGEDPIGRRLRVSLAGGGKTLQVVGVVRDVRTSFSNTRPLPFIYLPMEQHYSSGMKLVVRTSGNPSQMVERLRRLVYEVDERVGIEERKTMAEHMAFTLFPLRIATALAAMCGLVALLLAVAGLYGVVSYSVAQRTREIGIRTALGANRRAIIRMVLREGFTVILIGSALGLLLAIAARRVIGRISLGVVSFDPVSLVVIPVFLGAVVLLACYVPARRAARIAPMDALREL
jgi:ABC-type antimicrobial peptide transport system permease subunit